MSEDPTTPTRSARGAATLVVVAVATFGLALATLIGVTTVRVVDASRGSAAVELQDERDAVIARAEEFLLLMGSYGPDQVNEAGEMPEYRRAVSELLTSKFAAEFAEQAAVVEQLVVQAEQSRTAEVFGAGVSRLDEDTAVAVVAGAFTDSYGDGEALAPSAFRLQVTLVKIGGVWLVDDFEPITGSTWRRPAPEQPEEPGPGDEPDGDPEDPDDETPEDEAPEDEAPEDEAPEDEAPEDEGEQP
ncbi:hypothetical protein [Nocardioides limicola]|uniref:hypothetical protein n=1 Tax=Nocardioides limicola TaxID=2803368 RepID=UPI00193B97C7|nr:hypothetical protein [Nocardioides sp. DJM-14]